jgi:hypothetical protein
MRQDWCVTGPDPMPPAGVAAARKVSRREALTACRSGPVAFAEWRQLGHRSSLRP